MLKRVGLSTWLLILFLSLLAVPVFASNESTTVYNDSNVVDRVGDYLVVISPPPDVIRDTSGFDGTWTFWELPLWLKTIYITGILTGLVVTVIGIVKIIPVIIGKIADVLENQNRRRIYTYIEKTPGCTTAEISRNENLNLGTVKHHTNMLERSARITSERIGKFVRLFKRSDDYSDREKLLTAAMKNNMGSLIIVAIRENPGITNARLSEMLGTSEGTTHWHTNRLIQDRIVIAEKNKKKNKELYIPDDLKSALDMIIASG